MEDGSDDGNAVTPPAPLSSTGSHLSSPRRHFRWQIGRSPAGPPRPPSGADLVPAPLARSAPSGGRLGDRLGIVRASCQWPPMAGSNRPGWRHGRAHNLRGFCPLLYRQPAASSALQGSAVGSDSLALRSAPPMRSSAHVSLGGEA